MTSSSDEIPFVDLAAEHASLSDEIAAAVARVVSSGRFVLGPEVEAFEQEAARYLGSPHAVAVSSGTDALLVALLAAGLGPGDEVLTTPLTFFATVESALRIGLVVRLVDVDPATLCMDVQRLKETVTARTRAILPVHLYGNCLPMDELLTVAARSGAAVVEDAAQAFGSRRAGRCAGTWGKLACFSFFPTKVLGALGDGGLVVTADAALAGKCRDLRRHGADEQRRYHSIGGNFRLDAIQAAILRIKLRALDDSLRARRAIAALYDQAFADVPGLRVVQQGDPSGWNAAIYTLRVADGHRNALRAALAERGIETAAYYTRPIHREPAFSRFLVPTQAPLPESERAANEVLSLPARPTLSSRHAERIIDGVRSFFR